MEVSNLLELEKDRPIKIGIFRALQLGDMLCIIPAIRALRNYFTNAEITLIGLPWGKLLIERFPNYFNKFIHFSGYPGLPEQKLNPTAYIAFLKNIQDEKFDLVLQMQGNGSIVNSMIELWAGKLTAGFYTPDHYYPNNGLFLNYPEKIHEIERHIKLMEHLGIEVYGKQLEFPIFDEDIKELNDLNLPIIPRKYVCVHPGSRGAWRQWPVEHFANLANYCAEKGLQIVMTGTNDELPIIDKVVSLINYPVIIAAVMVVHH